MEPPDSLLSDYFLSEHELHQLMEHLVDDTANSGTLLGFTDEVRFVPDEPLIQQGVVGDHSIYILTEGVLDVVLETDGQKTKVASIEPYAVFGEQSFIDGGPRSATVIARTEGLAHRLTDSGFEQVRSVHPEVACAFLIDIARGQAQRLRQRG